jgi:gamma-glutamylcyclotransferase (GGCT)/AIG2-like uncharacterized protein YtfP
LILQAAEAKMTSKFYNLFVYGSLRDPGIFKSISGLDFTVEPTETSPETLLAVPAFLPRYRKVSPDNVYFYAIADPAFKIEGFVILNVPESVMVDIDRYEGKRYDRETVHVNTAKGLIEAQAYLASHESMKKHFGDRFHVNLIHELWLRKRIEQFINKHTRPGEDTADAELERRAQRELLATTERDLVITHYRSEAVSDFFLERELDKPRPTIKHLFDDPESQPYIPNYLKLVIKQVLLNQLDEKIQSRYRYDLERMRISDRYFKRSVSLLVALQIINTNVSLVDMIIKEGLDTIEYGKNDLIDYVKYAVGAADSLFYKDVVRAHIERVRSNFQPGILPIGAEIELSNLGPWTIEPYRSASKLTDPVYDGFRYFQEFCLDVLSWKLGGYVDDHSGSSEYGRRFGFLELAPGRLNIVGELSRPSTPDPWLLNQLIHEIIYFYDIRPHSLHLSFQILKHQIGHQKLLPLGFVKCLLALGGGIMEKETGRLWVSRMAHDEITARRIGEELVFTRTSKRNWYKGSVESSDIAPPKQATTHIQQYKFIRLDQRANYEPLILCLKGLQISYNPADYLTAQQLKNSPKLRREYEQLKQWAADPTEISYSTIKNFLKAVQDGLMTERHNQPAHKLHYIDWAISAVDVQLRMFNKQIKKTKETSS